MKLYVRQKVFSWRDRFTVKDENGVDKYYVEGELFSWGKKLHIYNMAGNEVAFIQQKVFSFLPRYYVFIDGRQAAEIVKEFSFFKPRYSIAGPGWTVEGNIWAHDYRIENNGRYIVSIRKEWLTWGDCYTLDIADRKDEIIAMAVVLTIDCVMAAQNAAAGSSGT